MSVGRDPPPPPPPPAPPAPGPTARVVADGAILQCSMGMAPSALHVPPRAGATRKVDGFEVATVDDHQPYTNVPPFALCRSMQNPAVRSATVAAGGALTPAPCTPILPDRWSPGAQGAWLDGPPLLTDRSTLSCQFGGTVSITSANSAVTVE